MSDNKSIADVKQALLNLVDGHAQDCSVNYLTPAVQAYKTLCEAEAIEQQTAWEGSDEAKEIRRYQCMPTGAQQQVSTDDEAEMQQQQLRHAEGE